MGPCNMTLFSTSPSFSRFDTILSIDCSETPFHWHAGDFDVVLLFYNTPF